MQDKEFLMIPGPTPVPQSVLLDMAKHPMGHRSSEFSSLLSEVYNDLKWAFQTKNEVFVYTASGTGAMEAAISNVVNKGDKVLSLVIGNFGERWAKIAASVGAEVEKIQVDPGQAINPAVLSKRLKEDVNKEIKVVTMTHNETSTGVTNDVQTLCAMVQEHGALSIVDGITSVGCMPVKADEWGIDILISGSQKGFMIPPGLSFLTCSEKAMKAYEQCEHPSFYFDFKAYKKAVNDNSTPYTPAVNLFIALHTALQMMKKEGLENIYARHARNAKAVRAAMRAMNMPLFVEDDEIASKAITAVLPPEGITVPQIRSTMKKDFDIVIANGQGKLVDKIFRMGHMGFVSDRDVLSAISSLEATMYKLGHKFEVGAGTAAAIKVLNEAKQKALV